MASRALADKVLTETAFTTVIWAIIANTFVSPFLFHWAIARWQKNAAPPDEDGIELP